MKILVTISNSNETVIIVKHSVQSCYTEYECMSLYFAEGNSKAVRALMFQPKVNQFDTRVTQ